MPRYWLLRDRRLQQQAMESVADMEIERRRVAQERAAQHTLHPAPPLEARGVSQDPPRRAA